MNKQVLSKFILAGIDFIGIFLPFFIALFIVDALIGDMNNYWCGMVLD